MRAIKALPPSIHTSIRRPRPPLSFPPPSPRFLAPRLEKSLAGVRLNRRRSTPFPAIVKLPAPSPLPYSLSLASAQPLRPSLFFFVQRFEQSELHQRTSAQHLRPLRPLAAATHDGTRRRHPRLHREVPHPVVFFPESPGHRSIAAHKQQLRRNVISGEAAAKVRSARPHRPCSVPALRK